jgi:hypothetical protein
MVSGKRKSDVSLDCPHFQIKDAGILLQNDYKQMHPNQGRYLQKLLGKRDLYGTF